MINNFLEADNRAFSENAQNPLSPPRSACLTGGVKQKVDLGIWSWLAQAVVALVAIAALLLIGMAYLPEIQKNERMRREVERLTAEVEKQKAISQQLQLEFNALRNDPKTIERLARANLGYARPDETVIRFETNAPVR
jgi:cell division protein FtsB